MSGGVEEVVLISFFAIPASRGGMRLGTAGTLMRPGVLRAVPRTALVELKGFLTSPRSAKTKKPPGGGLFCFGGAV